MCMLSGLSSQSTDHYNSRVQPPRHFVQWSVGTCESFFCSLVDPVSSDLLLIHLPCHNSTLSACNHLPPMLFLYGSGGTYDIECFVWGYRW